MINKNRAHPHTLSELWDKKKNNTTLIPETFGLCVTSGTNKQQKNGNRVVENV